MHNDVNYLELGKKFELGPCSIRAAIQRACAEAAYRGSISQLNKTQTPKILNDKEEIVRMRDFVAAGEIEVTKMRDQYFEITSRMFS